MPEPGGSTSTPVAAEPAAGFLDALEALVEAGPAYGDGLAALDPVTPDSEQAAPVAATQAADTPAASPGETAALASVDDIVTDGEQTSLEAGDPALSAGDVPGSDQAAAGDERSSGSRRGPWRELEAERTRAADLERQLAEARGQAPAPTAAPATAPTAANDALAQNEVLEFLGMAEPLDESGKPTGEPKLFERLHRESTSPGGIQYDDEQKTYAELSLRGAMAGKIFSLARKVAWQEITGKLVDPDLGLDEKRVEATGGIDGWKAEYRKELEQKLAGQRNDEIAGLRDEWDRERASLEEKLSEANKKLIEQPGSYDASRARARGFRSPLTGGRSAPAGAVAPAALVGTSDDLTDQLAAAFRERSMAAQ